MKRTVVYTNSKGDTFVELLYTARETIDYLEMLSKRYDRGQVTTNGRESSVHVFTAQEIDGPFQCAVTIIPHWDDNAPKWR